MSSRRLAHFSPARFLLISVLGTVLVGALVLSLPICRNVIMAPIDLLFTSAAATCVSGFLTVSLNDFTTFGHVVILVLMQIGGLGIITLTLFLMSIFLRLNFSTQLMAGQLLELESWKNIRGVIFFIIGFTFLLELIGAVSIFCNIYTEYPLGEAIFLSVFHSVSAFCHAGFSLFPDNLANYQSAPGMLIPIALVVLCSSLGFLVWYEMIQYLKAWRKKKWFTVSLHTKIVLFVTASLVILGTASYFFLEYSNTLDTLPTSLKALNAFFDVVASRGTGFTTVEVSDLRSATLLIIMILAFISASPGSPGSGIKTTTLAVFIASVKAAITGRANVSLFGRTISRDQVKRALAIVTLSVLWILFMLLLLLLTESDKPFLSVLFELVSAFGTLGLSTGITPNLSFFGKILIITSMIAGRVGALAFFLAIIRTPKQVEFSYPEERIMLG